MIVVLVRGRGARGGGRGAGGAGGGGRGAGSAGGSGGCGRGTGGTGGGGHGTGGAGGCWQDRKCGGLGGGSAYPFMSMSSSSSSSWSRVWHCFVQYFLELYRRTTIYRHREREK